MESCERKVFFPKETIVQEGDEGDTAFIIEYGNTEAFAGDVKVRTLPSACTVFPSTSGRVLF